MDLFLQILYTVLVLGFLIFVHELGHFIAAKSFRIRVNEFSLGMGPAIFKKQKGETLYALRCLPIGGYVSMEGEDETSDDANAMTNKPVWQRMIVVVAGAFMNLVIGFLLTLCLVVFFQQLPSQTVGGFTEDSLTAVYLMKEDQIIRVNDKKIHIYTDITAELSRCYGEDCADFTVKRNGETVELQDVPLPVLTTADGGLSYPTIDFLVYPEEKTVGTVLKHAIFDTGAYATMMLSTVLDLITGRAPLQYVSGPIGTSEVIAEAASLGFPSFLYLVALLSLNLCVVNLLPLPALDGGRFLFMLVELIAGRPIPRKYEAVIHAIGFIVLMLLMIVIAFKDIFFPVTI